MKLLGYASLVALLASMAGCGSHVPPGAGDNSGPTTETKTVSWYGYAEEYRATGKSLTMPKGVPFPSAPPMSLGSSDDFEVGLGATDAVIVWNCAWGRSFLKAPEGSKAKAHALKMFTKIKDTASWRVGFDDGSRQITLDAVASARLGDVSELRDVLDGQCPRSRAD